MPDTDPKTVPLWTVVPLRLYLACGFARAAYNKIGSHWAPWPHALAGFSTSQLPHEAAWYRAFLTSVVIPHAGLFAPLVAIAECVVAISLFLGLGARVGAVIGMLLTLNYWLLKGDTPWTISNDLAFCVGLAAIAITGAGRVLGVDAWLARNTRS